MYLKVFNFENKVLKKVSTSFFCIKDIRYDLIHQLILWQQSKKRLAISHSKGISEVQGSTRKIYKQKGTGGARHGSIRGAQFVGGGIIFGPNKNKVYLRKINKKIKKMALLNALAFKYNEKSIFIYENFKINTCKFKNFLQLFNNEFSFEKVLFIDYDFSFNFIKSISNNKNISILKLDGINVLDIIKNNKIFFSENAFNAMILRLK